MRTVFLGCQTSVKDWFLLRCFPTAAALATAAATQIPGRREHGLTRAGGGLEHWLHAGNDSNGSCGSGRLAFGCNHDDHVALLEIL